MVSGRIGSKWEDVGPIFLAEMPQEGAVVSIDGDALQSFPGSCSRLKFECVDFSGEDALVLDDISAYMSSPVEIRMLMDDYPVIENRIVLNNLNPDAEYFFSVKGVSETGRVSEATEFVHALGIAAPVALPATDIDSEKGSFTANWKHCSKAVGYTVETYRMQTLDDDCKDFKVIEERFDDVPDADPDCLYDEYYEEYFDEFMAMEGWHSDLGITAGGSIGADEFGTLYSPVMTLINGGGAYRVRIKAETYPGEILVVQAGDDYRVIEFERSDDDGYGFVENEAVLEFDNGSAHQSFMIYGLKYDSPFLIDEFEVTQDVAKGDRLYYYGTEKLTDGEECSVDIENLPVEPLQDYAYCVKSHGEYRGKGMTSVYSADIPVLMTSVGIEKAILGNIGIHCEKGWVTVEPGDEDVRLIEIFDMSGNIIARVDVSSPGLIRIPVSVDGPAVISISSSDERHVVKTMLVK